MEPFQNILQSRTCQPLKLDQCDHRKVNRHRTALDLSERLRTFSLF
jgi:hypothetical protein